MASSQQYEHELVAARKAVQLASRATKKMQNVSDKGIQDKVDESPVTVADFAAQALLICAIHREFPNDEFVAEESSEMLRANPALLDRVFGLVRSVATKEDNPFGLQVPETKEQLMDVIDLGYKDDAPNTGRLWILDPVDGTATFMTGNQYAVCLALVEKGVQKVAVLGLPNMLFDEADGRVEETLVDKSPTGGLILSAVEGHGAQVARLSEAVDGPHRKVLRDGSQLQSKLRFTDSAKSPNVTLSVHEKVYEQLSITKEPLDIWAMQVKYIALALGAADASVRVPPKKDYRACVWDHAGGQLIFQEAGGKVTDLNGNRFDFGLGRRLKHNYGLVAAVETVHSKVFDTLRTELPL